jgi:hypothetical protein
VKAWCVVLLVACQQHKQPPPPEVPRPAVHAKELFDHPEWIGTEVRVDLFEPFYDSEHSSAAGPDELDVEVADVGPKRLALAPAEHQTLPANLRPPVHVRATLREAAHGLRLVASAIEPFEFPKPTKLVHPGDILTDKARWSGALVTFEADWLVGFEGSYVDRGIWMDLYPTANVVCAPPPPPDTAIDYGGKTYRVRVVGVAHTAGRYGHLSMSDGEITATEVVYLDPKRPECR